MKPNNYEILLLYNNIYYKSQFIIYKLKKRDKMLKKYNRVSQKFKHKQVK